jgi:hypothetical protein
MDGRMNAEQWLQFIVCGSIPLALVVFVATLHNEASSGRLKPPKYKAANNGESVYYCSHDEGSEARIGVAYQNHNPDGIGRKMTANEIAAARSGAAMWKAARDEKPVSRHEIEIKAAGENEFRYWRKPDDAK